LIQRRKTGLERCILLITASILSSHQTDLSAMYSGPELTIFSCPAVHSSYTNGFLLATVYLSLL